MATLVARPAFADDDDMPGNTPAQPAAPAPPAPPAPGPARATEEPASEFERLARPPAQPVPVPTPSPVVVGGKPLAPGRFARPLEWKRARYSKLDFVVTVAGGAWTLAAAILDPAPKHVRGPLLFDKPIEENLRAPTVQQQYIYRDASDVGLSLLATWPFFVDALITAWWYRGSRDTAEQMALVGLETLAVSGAVQGITNVIVSRERPYGEGCGKTGLADRPANALDCTGSTHYRSFFSGHSAFSFTGASLICFEHTELHLLGGPWDAISCIGGYAVAATTATFRVTGGEHYPSDVITGAIVGTAIGWGVPLLHFKRPELGQVKTTGMTMRIVPSGTGAGVVGTF